MNHSQFPKTHWNMAPIMAPTKQPKTRKEKPPKTTTNYIFPIKHIIFRTNFTIEKQPEFCLRKQPKKIQHILKQIQVLRHLFLESPPIGEILGCP